ncbi:MAG: RsbRD N-terminal domain-containing protein [Roseateles sp.]|uniref:RsbRD N-terminal domain-containing protein n=1 Tax=Roseateles sp. TaxID=1971397 RepID=UPI004035BC2E
MRLSTFILTHLDTIVDEWVAFARQLSQAGPALSESALADHSREILSTIAEDMDTAQGEPARQAKARGHAASHDRPGRTAAGAHGAVRLLDGFDLDDMVAEYRALRACVLKHWRDAGDGVQDRREAVEEIARFNEAIDQAIAESPSTTTPWTWRGRATCSWACSVTTCATRSASSTTRPPCSTGLTCRCLPGSKPWNGCGAPLGACAA